MGLSTRTIKSVAELVVAVREDSAAWPIEQPRWFRGEPASEQPLLPTLYRKGLGDRENPLLQTFRVMASGYADVVPQRGNTDQWLFLARHAGLPTRLLDWTEGALLGLHFALRAQAGVLWMLNPLQLNWCAYGAPDTDPAAEREFPLTWFDPSPNGKNIAFENIAGAWVHDRQGADLPVAIHPTYVHPRLRAQRACFTVQGKRKVGLNALVPDTILVRYAIDPACREPMVRDLRLLGITESVAFPDLDGLARELEERFS